jgi:hypothetical protein
VIDDHPSPATTLENVELLTLAWDQLQKRLSECSFQILRMRLVEQRSVAEVASELGLSNEQVWYRYHRARRDMLQLGSTLARAQPPTCSHAGQLHEKKGERLTNRASRGGLLRITNCRLQFVHASRRQL